MWQKTSKGLHKQFKFTGFNDVISFVQSITTSNPSLVSHIRWENKQNELNIWLASPQQSGLEVITNDDQQFAKDIDSQFNKLHPVNSPSPVKGKKVEEIKIFTDGGSRGNPGPSASGYALLDMQDNVIRQEGVYIGITTNNQAEYHALKIALEACRELQPTKIHVFMDSLLVVNQMLGKYKVRNRDLWPIHQSITELVKSFKTVTFTQVPREYNKLADSLVNQALDDELSKQ